MAKLCTAILCTAILLFFFSFIFNLFCGFAFTFSNIVGDELLLNFGAKLHRKCNYKIAMATFRTSQCQDGDQVLKCRA